MPSTISYQAGDVVLVDFPFTVSGQGKPRPALVILDTGDADVLLARVTTQSRATPYDVTLAGWAQAGLLAPSIVRLHNWQLWRNRVSKATSVRLSPMIANRLQAYCGRLQLRGNGRSPSSCVRAACSGRRWTALGLPWQPEPIGLLRFLWMMRQAADSGRRTIGLSRWLGRFGIGAD
jgi:mRNA interferase MazF